MTLSCSPDAMFLALVSMLQITRPALLKSSEGGFDVDVTPLLDQPNLTADEQLVLRIYGVLSNMGENTSVSLDLSPSESSRLDRALALVESSRAWPTDALALTRQLRSTLK